MAPSRPTNKRRRRPRREREIARKPASYRIPSKSRRRKYMAAALSVLLVVGATVGLYWPELYRAYVDGASGRGRGYNVLIVTLDTVRADHLACYGHDLIKTPVIDQLAAAGARFEQAFTAVPMTLPAHATIMTGLYPPNHGVRDNGTFRLLPERETMAEVFRNNGYATAAFIAAFVLDKRYGLDQGFDHYDDRLTQEYRLPTPNASPNPDRPANVVVDAALTWLDRHHTEHADQPFFAWVHLFDAHMPYAPPEPYRSQYADRLYDGEIAFVDEQLGRLFDGLRADGLEQRTLIVLVGDHGEGLGEHFEDTHRQLIYDSTMHVPLILHGPGVIAPRQVLHDFPASTVDILPTVLDLTGLATDSRGDGIALFAHDMDTDRGVYMETLSSQLNDGWAPLFGIRRLTDKYIDAPNAEYYDVSNDPGELNNLLATRQDVATEIANQLADLRAAFPEKADASAVAPTQDEIDRLAALGYVVGPGASAARSDLDPKIMIQSYKSRLRGAHLLNQGKPHDAIAVFEKLIQQSGGGAEVWSLLSSAQMMLGHTEDAIRSAKRAVELNPAKPDRWCALARLYLKAGNDTEAEVCLAEAERLDPLDGTPLLIRARRSLAAAEFDEAVRYCREAAERDPARSFAKAWALIGTIEDREGLPATAKSAFELALEHDPRNGAAIYGLARIYARKGEKQKAVELLELLIEGQVEYFDGGRLLGQLNFELGRADVAINILRIVVRRRPSDGLAHYQLARALAWSGRDEAALRHLESAASLGAVDWPTMREDPAFAGFAHHPRVAALEAGARSP